MARVSVLKYVNARNGEHYIFFKMPIVSENYVFQNVHPLQKI